MRQLQICVFGLVLLAVTNQNAASISLGGRIYEQEGDVWSWVDSEGESWEIAPDWIEIKFDEGVTSQQLATFASEHSLTPSAVNTGDGYKRYLYGMSVDPIDVLEAVLESALVIDAELAYRVKPQSDPHFTFQKQWNGYLIDLDRALAVTRGSAEILLAIIDSGVDKEHEDLAATVWTNPEEPIDLEDNDDDVSWYDVEIPDDTWGWDFVHHTDPYPFNSGTGHGTAVVGIAVAVNDNSIGLASPAGGGVSSRPIRWLACVGPISFAARDAFRYCKHKGVKVVNVSFTISADDTRATAGINEYIDTGGLIVAASGNTCYSPGGTGTGVAFPASHDSVLAVGAIDSLLAHWDYSCDGPELDLVAPAGYYRYSLLPPNASFHWTTDNYRLDHPEINPGSCNCETRVPDTEYTLSGGTSSAAPMVAGLAALVWSQRPDLTAPQVKALLRRTARDLGATGRDDLYGYGMVDAYRAVTRWGTITQNTTWSGTIHVSADITVNSGVTLTIDPGTQIYIAEDDNDGAGADASRIEFNVAGTVTANGSTSPITFQSMSPTGSWVGLKFQSASAGTLTNVHIKDADRAIETNVSMTLTNCAFTDCETGLDVYAGTTSLTKCTVASNSVSATVIRGSSTINISKCVVAYNDGPAVRVISGSSTMANSVVFQNTTAAGSPTDTDWQTNGTNVLSDNPAFCNLTNEDYRLYAFSPAAAGPHFTDRAGAFDIGCAPEATITVTSPFRQACPAGDNSNFVVTVDLDNSVMTRNVGASELRLDIQDFAAKVFEADGIVSATGAATAANGYVTTIEHAAFGYYCKDDNADILLNGFPLAAQASMNVRTADCASSFGTINLVDGALYNTHHTSPPKTYNASCDFNDDSAIGLADFGFFGTHYGHSSPYSPSNVSTPIPQASAHTVLQFVEEFPTATTHRLYVHVGIRDFENVLSAAFCFRPENERLTFVDWIPAGSDIGNLMFSPVVRDGHQQLFFLLTMSDSFEEPAAAVGTMVFDVDGMQPVDATSADFTQTVADILLGSGEDNQALGSMSATVIGLAEPSLSRVYHDRLEQNFPNPFNPTTAIAFSLREARNVELRIFDVGGRQVRELVNGRRERGAYVVSWDGMNDRGVRVSSGVYFYRMKAGTFIDTKKMIMLK